MPITVVFSTTQVVGAPGEIVINDQSTGSDVTAVNRRVFIRNQAGQYIDANGVSDSSVYTVWPLADGNTLTIGGLVLPQDSAYNITLMYVNVSGVSVSQDTELCGFTLYNESFYYTLTQDQALQNQPPPMIIQDSNYYSNKLILRTQIDSGNQAISLGGDITTAQNAYDLATYMRINEGDFF